MHPLRALIRRFDAWLSRQLRVRVFSNDPRCLLRIQTGRVPRTLHLPDGLIRRGTPALMVHMWNARAPLIPPAGPDLAWALETSRRLVHSLRLVAGRLQSDPSLAEVRAVGGVTAHVLLDAPDGGRAMLEHLGFTVIPYHRPLGRFGELWENFFTWWLMWTFNPPSTRRRSMWNLQRSEFWASRAAFLRRYGGG